MAEEFDYAKAMEELEAIAQKVEDSLTEISTLCDTLATAEDAAAVKADLTNKVNRLNKYLTTIKTL